LAILASTKLIYTRKIERNWTRWKLDKFDFRLTKSQQQLDWVLLF